MFQDFVQTYLWTAPLSRPPCFNMNLPGRWSLLEIDSSFHIILHVTFAFCFQYGYVI